MGINFQKLNIMTTTKRKKSHHIKFNKKKSTRFGEYFVCIVNKNGKVLYRFYDTKSNIYIAEYYPDKEYLWVPSKSREELNDSNRFFKMAVDFAKDDYKFKYSKRTINTDLQ